MKSGPATGMISYANMDLQSGVCVTNLVENDWDFGSSRTIGLATSLLTSGLRLYGILEVSLSSSTLTFLTFYLQDFQLKHRRTAEPRII